MLKSILSYLNLKLFKTEVKTINGIKLHFKNGKLHRDGGPAVEYPDGTLVWYQNGLRHRDIGPAVIYSDKTCYFYKHGLLHRRPGSPAVIWNNGMFACYEQGKYLGSKDYIIWWGYKNWSEGLRSLRASELSDDRQFRQPWAI